MKDLQMLLRAKESSGEPYTNFFIPKKYTNEASYNKIMDSLEE